MYFILSCLFTPVAIPFYLFATMYVDSGTALELPHMRIEKFLDKDPQIHAKNIYVVLIKTNNQLLVDGELMHISQLKDRAKRFIDNNGKDPNSSENPQKAIISLKTDKRTSYETYIRVQNELTTAYNELRNKAALNKFGERYANLNKTKKKEIKEMYPQKISEAEPKNNNE